MSDKIFDGLVKAVIDINKEVMAVDAEMHADQEDYLLKHVKHGDRVAASLLTVIREQSYWQHQAFFNEDMDCHRFLQILLIWFLQWYNKRSKNNSTSK